MYKELHALALTKCVLVWDRTVGKWCKVFFADKYLSNVKCLELYQKHKDTALVENCDLAEKQEARDPKFAKGQSRRIWNELHKVSLHNFSQVDAK